MTRLFLVCVLLTATVQAQEEPAPLEVSEVSPGVHFLVGAGGNFVLLTGEHTVLFDDGYPSYVSSVLDTVQQIAAKPIDFVVNTHVHSDHTGANAAFAGMGSHVIAHENLRTRLALKPEDAGGATGIPIITFSDEITFHINDLAANVFHVPSAHTDGDAVIVFEGINVIYAGDVHFNYLFPFVDLDQGGTITGFAAAQRKIIALANDETIILPGHGPAASKADLQAAVDMLVDAEASVKALVDQGMSQEEVLAQNPLALYHDDWNWGFITTERMTGTLYRSLTSKD